MALSKSEKEVNILTLEKAALFGFLDLIIDEIPKPHRRDYFRQKIATNKLIKPIGWVDEMPYTES